MKKNLFAILLVLTLLAALPSCTMPDAGGTTSSSEDMASSNPTDNTSLLDSLLNPSPEPDGAYQNNDGVINDLSSAASDAIDDVQEGFDDLTTTESGTNTGAGAR